MGALAAFFRFCPSWAGPRPRCVDVGVGAGGCDEEERHRPHSQLRDWQSQHRVVQVGDSQVYQLPLVALVPLHLRRPHPTLRWSCWRCCLRDGCL